MMSRWRELAFFLIPDVVRPDSSFSAATNHLLVLEFRVSYKINNIQKQILSLKNIASIKRYASRTKL